MARARKDPRHRAREAALQILYQWDLAHRDIAGMYQVLARSGAASA